MISRILALASRRFCRSILKIRCSSHKQSCFRVNAKPPPLSSLVRGFCMSPSPHPKTDTDAMKQNKYHQSIWGSKINNSSKKIAKSSPILFALEWEEKKKNNHPTVRELPLPKLVMPSQSTSREPQFCGRC